MSADVVYLLLLVGAAAYLAGQEVGKQTAYRFVAEQAIADAEPCDCEMPDCEECTEWAIHLEEQKADNAAS